MKQYYGQKWYRPREIAQLGLIQSSSGRNNETGNYNFVLELIKTGRLRAKDYSKGKKPNWLVPESEITRYHQTVTRIKP